MTCDLDRVDALADGRLDGPEAKEVMEHLAGCPQCRAYYEGALAADRVLADTGINPPAGAVAPGGGRTGRVPAAGGGGDLGAAPGGP